MNENNLSEKTTEELRDTCVSLHRSIYVNDCFGVNDLLHLELIEKELKRRGKEVAIETSVKTKGHRKNEKN